MPDDFKDASWDGDGDIFNLQDIISDARKVIVSALNYQQNDKATKDQKKCVDLFGDNALETFDKLSANISYDETGNVVGDMSAVTTNEGIFLNPHDKVFNSAARELVPNVTKRSHEYLIQKNESINDYGNFINQSGISFYDNAVATLLHEVLHKIGKFPADVRITTYADGTVSRSSSKSREHQKELIKKYFTYLTASD
ncbi:MAG: hypothetical protein KIS76_01835 [Pyrinomonadaceae bacterium]|nr:hypothetical protein [Pyrinomonadaceae bacterium]